MEIILVLHLALTCRWMAVVPGNTRTLAGSVQTMLIVLVCVCMCEWVCLCIFFLFA